MTRIEIIEVIQTRLVRGCSKSNFVFVPYSELVSPLFTKYEKRAVMIIRIRIANIQMISVADIRGFVAKARARKATRATPVTP
ncbi:MAG: hypothetical protein A4E58_01332 [Syntrophorhabdus sp. PtaB.Bin006]|nr:MAG: hypothetical protein A4E58_01332 [Syntrophorhabdus sp. PtaB.Bin006]